MASDKPVQKFSAAEYLQIERAAESKSEFRNGEVFAMSGGTYAHSLIASNIGGELREKLKGGPCVTCTSDLRVKIEMAGLYTYPDVSVVCGERQFEDATHDVLLNPCLIVEILSESSESYDRGKKFEWYRRIPSLREYLLVSQREALVEQFIRQPAGGWLLQEVSGMEAMLSLPSLGIVVALAEVFAKVEFPSGPLRIWRVERA
jgi:Uma2 family endonuclease